MAHKLHPYQAETLESYRADLKRHAGYIHAWDGLIPALEPAPTYHQFNQTRLELQYPYNRALMDQLRKQMEALGWKLVREITEAELLKSWDHPCQYWDHPNGKVDLRLIFSDYLAGATCKRKVIAQKTTHVFTGTDYTYEFCPQQPPEA